MHVCVIGAGPAGLTAIRQITKSGTLTGQVFEQADHLGGTWYFTSSTDPKNAQYPSCSAIYKTLRTNLPKELMRFYDFRIVNDPLSYVSHEAILQYLQDYATAFNLLPHIQLNSRVILMQPIFNRANPNESPEWHVTVENMKNSQISKHVFDAVVICTGSNLYPVKGDLAGLGQFQGIVMHSKDYRNREIFTQKNVVLVGLGPSAMDIALDIADLAVQVNIANNSKVFALGIMPSNVKSVTRIKAVGADFVTLEDDRMLPCDILVMCTGYRNVYPFLHKDCQVIIDQDKYVQPLYKHLIHTKYPTLTFVNLVYPAHQFLEIQVEVSFIMKFLQGCMKLPSEVEMNNDIANSEHSRASEGLPVKRHCFGDGAMKQFPHYETLIQLAGLKNEFQDLPVIAEVYRQVISRLKSFTPLQKRDLVRIVDKFTYTYWCAPGAGYGYASPEEFITFAQNPETGSVDIVSNHTKSETQNGF